MLVVVLAALLVGAAGIAYSKLVYAENSSARSMAGQRAKHFCPLVDSRFQLRAWERTITGNSIYYILDTEGKHILKFFCGIFDLERSLTASCASIIIP
ncbi:MAG: hypothetical protein N3E45_13860 [Oscillatoriaceae bacterium SKW80]|nr:hypothetical protein [Oscillatoriaceae bacterium SKYG93]MCX8121885.1 hypothetical protein [Oscillatoriaceae bacterium SKW80]MDW8454646.1 hypothetical protein [Oscillatoriaceae cyanobacterium SKYGB_i_bin93]HIK28648.1 hypothetical protein [Oscillatoriaceae cyanobacterium M7585_C2015_266]